LEKQLTIEVRIDVVIQIAYSAKDRCFYAKSPQIDIVRDGQNPAEALQYFKNAFEILVESGLRKRTLDKILTAYGYELEEFRTDDSRLVKDFALPEYKRYKRRDIAEKEELMFWTSDYLYSCVCCYGSLWGLEHCHLTRQNQRIRSYVSA